MYKIIGKISAINVDYVTNKMKLEFEVDNSSDVSEMYEELKDKQLNIQVKKYSKARSLSANAYAWVLIDKLSEKLKLPKTEVYKSYIKEVGGNNTIVCVQDKAVETLINNWQHNGIGWLADTIDSKVDGCTNVILYYGSSSYDAKQMSRFTELIVHDCNELGIQTIPAPELSALIEAWRAKNERKS